MDPDNDEYRVLEAFGDVPNTWAVVNDFRQFVAYAASKNDANVLCVELQHLRMDGETRYRNVNSLHIGSVKHMAAQIAMLRAERDEARRECRLLLLGQEVLRGVRDLPAPPDDLVTIVPVPRKEHNPCQ